jgi:hypothetical protein
MRNYLFGAATASFFVSQFSPMDSIGFFAGAWSAIILTTIALFIKVAR